MDRSANGGSGPPSGGGPLTRLAEGALPATGWRQTFSSLSGNRDFLYLFSGNVAFFFGMNTMIILRGWLVIDEWDDAALLGYLMATVALPMLILAPIGGVIADRIDKRGLIFGAQVFLVLINTVVAVLIIMGAIEYWHLLVVSPLSSAAFALNMPARQALVAMLVPREKLMNAIALSTAAMNASRIIAPPLAGLLIVVIDIGPAYLLSTLCYAIAAGCTLLLPKMPPEREKEVTFVEDFKEGVSYMRHAPLLLGLLIFATVPMLFAMPYQTLLPVFAERVWHVDEIGYGLLQGVAGVGGFIGALMVANLDGYRRKGRLLLLGSLAMGGCLALFALSPWFGPALLFMAGVGLTSMIVMTVNNTAIQLITPDDVRGRVMSVMMLTFGLMPLGAVPAGVLAEAWGAPIVVAAGGLLFSASVLLMFAVLPSFRSLDEELEEGRERESRRQAAAARPAAAVGSR
jgi:predicted MFS family arabinose efflux permease